MRMVKFREIFGHSSKESEEDYDYNEMCEFCGCYFDSQDLHYFRVRLANGAGKTVNRCESCRLDMKQYVVSK